MRIKRVHLPGTQAAMVSLVDLQVMARLAGLNIWSDLGNQAALFLLIEDERSADQHPQAIAGQFRLSSCDRLATCRPSPEYMPHLMGYPYLVCKELSDIPKPGRLQN